MLVTFLLFSLIILQSILPWQVALSQEDLSPRVTDIVERLTHSSNPAVRSDAAAELAAIGPEAAAAIPALIEALKDQEARVRYTAAGALGAIGPEAAPALLALIEALKDQDTAVRTLAANTLTDIAIKLQNRGDVSVVNVLRKVQIALVASPDPAVKARGDEVGRAIGSLEGSGWRRWGEMVSLGTGVVGLLYLLILFPLLLLYPRSGWARSAVNSGLLSKFPILHKLVLNSQWARH
jgi:HEAT repeats